MDEHTAENDVHLSYRLGGCATAGHPTAVTDPAEVARVTCQVCLPAACVTPPVKGGV